MQKKVTPRLSELQQAFAIAQKASANADTNKDRAYFQAIAYLIWKSCGQGAHALKGEAQ